MTASDPQPRNPWHRKWPLMCSACRDDSSFIPASATLGDGHEMWQCCWCGTYAAGPEWVEVKPVVGR